jgi:Domain of unknown function (DUF1707)
LTLATRQTVGMGGRSSLRASDADRDQAAALLREHYAQGRLDVDELRDRIDKVYRSRTYGDLDGALVDLPGGSVGPLVGGTLAQVRAWSAERQRHRYRRGWIRFAWVNAVCWSIWCVQAVGSLGHLPLVWPLLVTVPWGIRRIARGPRTAGAAHRPPSIVTTMDGGRAGR